MSEWIPTADPTQWPPCGQEVLLAVTRPNGQRVVRTGFLAYGGDSWVGNGYPMYFNPPPSHWMPKPVAPAAAADDGVVPATYSEQLTMLQQSAQLVERVNDVLTSWYCLTMQSMRYGWTQERMMRQSELLAAIEAIPGIEWTRRPFENDLAAEPEYLISMLHQFLWKMVDKAMAKFDQGFSGWDQPEHLPMFRESLIKHIEKDRNGDQMIDVAIIAAFICWLEDNLALLEATINEQR